MSQFTERILSRKHSGPVQLPEDAAPRLAKIEGIKAVVFDVYGTLFSSGVGDISLATQQNRDAALRATLSENGIEILDTAKDRRFDDHLHAIIGKHQDDRRDSGIEFPEVDIRRVWAELIDELERDRTINPKVTPDPELLAVDYESRVNPIQPMPALAETLSALQSRGLVMSIISNAQFYTPFLFEAFLGNDLSELGFCSDSAVWSYAMLEGKPSTALYIKSAELLQQHHGLKPEEALYVGNDMRNDIWPAQKIGFRTALFAGDRLSLRRRIGDPHYTDAKADIELTSLDQILQVL
ncbi:MAG: HAD family hydrolase [Verrucomicrobiota bacterium]